LSSERMLFTKTAICTFFFKINIFYDERINDMDSSNVKCNVYLRRIMFCFALIGKRDFYGN